MSQVFSTTGGYMQVIYTLFGLIALLTKKISIEKKLLNSLFNFNIKQKKIILCIEYKKKLDYISSLDKDKKNSFIPYEAKKTLMNRKNKRSSINLMNRNTNVLDKMVIKKTDTGPIVYKSNINESIIQDNNIEEGLFHMFNKLSKNKIKKANLFDQSVNKSKVNMIYKESNSYLNDVQNLNGSISPNKKRVKKSKSNFDLIKLKKTIKISRQKDWSNINFNFLDYYCLRKMRKKNVEIELFHFGYNFYKSQMDIINFINIILLTQIIMMRQTDKKQNIMSQTIELSIN